MADIYERIQERLDQFPQGFGKTEGGVELELLKLIFTPEEGEILFHLHPAVPVTSSQIAASIGWNEEKVKDLLAEMSGKGTITKIQLPDLPDMFLLMPWFVGMGETISLVNPSAEYFKLFERYYSEGVVPTRKAITVPQFRVIPVESEVELTPEQVQPYEKASAIIDTYPKVAVMNCACKTIKIAQGKGCGRLLESCLMMGPFADAIIAGGFGREVSKEEAKQILRKAEEDGLVHMARNSRSNVLLCSCCPCCCLALGCLTRGDAANAIAKGEHHTLIDNAICNGCGICVDRCQVGAIKMENGKAQADKDRCIGCLLCASSCPEDAIKLIQRSPGEIAPIFNDDDELFQAMGKDRNRPYPFD